VSRLIVNSDDFGLTQGVNRAVMELYQAGVLTSATLMARAMATEEAIQMALSTPALGVGCHVVLVDGEPLLSSEEIPSLIDPETGAFWPTLGAFVVRLLSGRIRADEMEAEAFAQIRFLQSRGVRLSHIDTHKHAHMFPAVLKPVLRAASAADISVVRNPFEAEWSLRTTLQAARVRRWQVAVLKRLEPVFLRTVAAQGFHTTQGAVGVLATGAWREEQLCEWMNKMPSGDWELVTHPGYVESELHAVRTRLRESREAERSALLSVPAKNETARIAFSALASNQ